jgi:hypothetical protein
MTTHSVLKRLLITVLLVLLPTAWAETAELSSEDRKKAAAHLEKTRDVLLKTVGGLSEAQLNFKPSPDRWSVGEVVEHLAASEEGLMQLIQNRVMTLPGRTEQVDLAELDTLVLTAVADRSRKAQAPEELLPKKRFATTAEALKHFKEHRTKTLEFLQNTGGLRAHVMESRLGKPLDAYQWVLLISAHTERHTKQIDEVKADPNFPKK